MDRPHGGKNWFLACIPVAALLCAGVSRAADTASLELKQTIELEGKTGGLDHVAVDVKHDRLFLANKASSTLDIVDLKEGKLLKRIPNQSAIQGVAYAPDLNRVFVGLGIRGLFNVFDADSHKLLKTIKFEDDADNVRYHEATKLIYVAHAEKSLGVIDANTFELKADIKLPGSAEGFELEKARPRLYVCIPNPNTVAVIDTDKNEVINKHPLRLGAEAHPIALDEKNHRLFIGCRGKQPVVVVMDSETGQELTSLPIASEVDDLFYDAKRKKLYASCGEGFINVIRQLDANRYEAAEKIATTKGAKTSTFVAETSRLYLAVPRQEGKKGPEIRIYDVKP